MNNELRLFMIRHAGIVILIGSLAGLVYNFVISGDIPGSIGSWHLAHLQGVMTGMLILAVSSCVGHLILDPKKLHLLAYCFVVTGYCYSVGPVWGAVFRVRGLKPVAPLSNILMFASNSIASISVVIGIALMIYGSIKRHSSSTNPIQK